MGTQLAAANNLGVLGVVAATPAWCPPPYPDTVEYVSRAIGQINNFIQGVAHNFDTCWSLIESPYTRRPQSPLVFGNPIIPFDPLW